MELPIEIQMLINDYARPMTRPDWRQGSYISRTLRAERPIGFEEWEPEQKTRKYWNPDFFYDHFIILIDNAYFMRNIENWRESTVNLYCPR